MEHYYLNDNQQNNGDYEVHTDTCNWLPLPSNRIYLGYFSNCRDAVTKAKQLYPYRKINGCYFCCKECHTS